MAVVSRIRFGPASVRFERQPDSLNIIRSNEIRQLLSTIRYNEI